jgi:hypothetical protein
MASAITIGRGENPFRDGDPEGFEHVRLAFRAIEETVAPVRVQAAVPLGERAERPPPGGLAFHAKPEEFCFLERAERGSRQQVAVELDPSRLLARPPGEHLVAAERTNQISWSERSRGRPAGRVAEPSRIWTGGCSASRPRPRWRGCTSRRCGSTSGRD